MVSLATRCKYLDFQLKFEWAGLIHQYRTLPLGPQRNHFLGTATPEHVAEKKKMDSTGTVFQRADYGRAYSTVTSYTPSAVWAWLQCKEECPRMLAYNDFDEIPTS